MLSRNRCGVGCDVKRADCVALALQCRMIAESLSPANGFLVSASACEQIRFTRIAGVSDRGETTLFDYADYQVAGSLETLSGTVKQREDAEKAIQTAHQQRKSIRRIARDLGIPWRKANKLLNILELLRFYYNLSCQLYVAR